MTIPKRAIRHFGERRQLNKAAEECSELAASINRWIHDPDEIDHVAEEIADVEIMIEQLRVIVGSEIIDKWRDYKLARLDANINLSGITRDRIEDLGCIDFEDD